METFGQQLTRALLRKQAVKARFGIRADSTLYEWMAAGSFPKPIKIGPRAVAWVESELDAWERQRIAERDTALEADRG